MTVFQCPHCNVDNPLDAQFCESCGMAVSSSASGGPRVVGADDYASTDAGQQLQIEELKKQSKKAASALLAVAIMQAIFGTILIFAASALPGIPEGEINVIVYVYVYGIAFLFFGLFIWARKSPFPAAIAGLVLFVSVHLLDAVVDPTSLVRGIIVKVIIVAILIRAIKAGSAYRDLAQQM